MVWLAQLVGDSSILNELTRSFTDRDICVTHDGREYLLTSTLFLEESDATDIFRLAQDIAVQLRGMTALTIGGPNEITVAGVRRQRADGTRQQILFAEPGAVKIQAVPVAIQIVRADGTTVASFPADWVKRLISLRDEAVANVCRLYALGPPDWVNLYRIYELIEESVGGKDTIVERDWASRNAINRFKHTAQSRDAVGLCNARHGKRIAPPTKPMTIADARTLVRQIVDKWLRDKLSEHNVSIGRAV